MTITLPTKGFTSCFRDSGLLPPMPHGRRTLDFLPASVSCLNLRPSHGTASRASQKFMAQRRPATVTLHVQRVREKSIIEPLLPLSVRRHWLAVRKRYQTKASVDTMPAFPHRVVLMVSCDRMTAPTHRRFSWVSTCMGRP